MMKKYWGIILSYLSLIVLFLTTGIVVAFVVLDRIAQETNSHASMFGTWWQTLLFVLDIVLAIMAIFALVMVIIQKRNKNLVKEEKSGNFLVKNFHPGYVGVFLAATAIIFTIVTIATPILVDNESAINYALGINPYKTITNTSVGDTEYIKSDFIKYDENGDPLYITDDSGFKRQVYDDIAMRKNSERVTEEAANEGAVLMWNNLNALPLEKGSKLSIFGVAQRKFNYLFTGSGSGGLLTIKNDDFPNLKEELERDENGEPYYDVNDELWNHYESLGGGRQTYTPDVVKDKHFHAMKVNETPWSKVSNKSSTFSQYGDAAIMIISRNAGEDTDTWFETEECLDNDYLDLAINEKEVLDNLVQLKRDGVFKKVVVLLNTCNTFQMKNLRSYEDIDACLFVGTGGTTSFKTIFNLLSGKANPSGHFVDTYLYDNESAPSSVNTGAFQFTRLASNFPMDVRDSNEYNNAYIVYKEGIYVGYRYFETRYEDLVMNRGGASSSNGSVNKTGQWKYENEVAFPFGFGLSYTDFEYELIDVNKRNSGNKTLFDVEVKVTNIGELEGKTAVQIYLQKPYTNYDKENNIEKSSIELVGYTKTKSLEPNESENYTVTVDEYEFKTYDSYGAETYILEKGDYYLSVGTDAHNALNNILDAKGYTSVNGMVDSLGNPTNGNKDNTYKIVYANNDFEKYSVSLETGYEITNQFNNADRNLYEGTTDQPITYLSRNDWANTYPTSHELMRAVNPKLVEDILYTEFDEERYLDPDAVMPTLDANNGTNLAMMLGLDFDNPAWDDLLDNLSFEDMKKLLGNASYGLKGIESINSPAQIALDGPAGVKQVNPTTGTIMAFPQGVLLAQTMNDELTEEVGKAFGHELLHANVGQIYGTGANIHRSPYSGRNWEYKSEDGFISGKSTAAEARGIQSKGVILSIKHFALNDQEIYRCGVSTWANEQSIREIYLKAFEIPVVEAEANGLMSSLNRIGADWAGVHIGLQREVLRNEWGFRGVVITDAALGAYMRKGSSAAEGVISGTNLWLFSHGCNFDDYADNATVVSAMRDRAHEVLYTLSKSFSMNGFNSDTKIIKITPWYFTLVNTVQIVTGIISLLVFGLIIYLIIARRIEYCKTHDIEKEKAEKAAKRQQILEKRKKNDEETIIMNKKDVKKFLIIFNTIIGLLTVGLLTIAITYGVMISNLNNAIENGGYINSEEPDNSEVEDSDDPIVPTHVCENQCPVCGGCLNMECFEPECSRKCGDDKPTTTKFEATHYYVAKENGTTHIDGNSYVDMVSNSTVTYKFNSSSSGYVSLAISMIHNSETALSNLFTITNNGVNYVPKMSTKLSEEVQEVPTGCFNVNSGENIVVIKAKGTTKLASITLYNNFTSVTLVEAPGAEHVCENMCDWPNCGLCKDFECEHPNCSEKCPHIKNEFKAIDEHTVVTGNTKNKSEDCVGSKNNTLVSIEFPIHLSAETTVRIYVVISSNNKVHDFTTPYNFYINGVIQTTSAKTPQGAMWGDYTEIELGYYELSAGTNTIKFTIQYSSDGEFSPFNFRSLIVETSETIEWAELSCSSPCALCGKCFDFECTHTVCQEKCTCTYNVFSALDDRVSLVNANKNTKENCVGVVRDMLTEITFELDVSVTTEAEIIFNTCKWSSNRNLIQASANDETTIHVYDFYINSEEVYSDAKTSLASSTSGNIKYSEYCNTSIGVYDLKEGVNTFKLTVQFPDNGNINLNFRELGIKVSESSFAVIDWTN